MSLSLFKESCWRPPNIQQRLSDGAVAVLGWPVDRLAPSASDLLLAEESRRAERFRRGRDRAAFLMARAGLRSILGELLGVTPRGVALETADGGKPRLGGEHRQHPLRFNLSHSGGWALLAVSPRGEVGIDIECPPADKPTPISVADKCFTTAERAALDSASDTTQRDVFYRLWTRKEAVIKLTGEGLQADLLRFQTPSDPQTAGWIDLPSGNPLGLRRCWLESLPAPAGGHAALACEAKPQSVIRQELTLGTG